MITIELEATKLPKVKYEKDGAKREILLSHNTLFEFIKKNCFESEVSNRKFELPVFETPALPPNTVKYMAMPDGKVVLFLEEKASARDITYHNTKYKSVPFPNLLFQFTLKPSPEGYELTEKRVFSFKSKVLRESTPMYHFPFSHVMDNGSMCFFYSKEFKDLAQIVSFIHVWSTSNFTDHYYNGKGSRQNKFDMTLREIFEKTQNTKVFDNKALNSFGKTFDDLVKQEVNLYFPTK